MTTVIVLCSISAALILVDVILVLTLHNLNNRLTKKKKTPAEEEHSITQEE